MGEVADEVVDGSDNVVGAEGVAEIGADGEANSGVDEKQLLGDPEKGKSDIEGPTDESIQYIVSPLGKFLKSWSRLTTSSPPKAFSDEFYLFRFTLSCLMTIEVSLSLNSPFSSLAATGRLHPVSPPTSALRQQELHTFHLGFAGIEVVFRL